MVNEVPLRGGPRWIVSIQTNPGGYQEQARRGRGWDTGWRRLPMLLVETPEGGAWHLETESGQQWIEEGTVLVVPPGMPHRLLARTSGVLLSSWILLQWEVEGLPVRWSPQAAVFVESHVRGALKEMIALLKGIPSLPAQAQFHARSMVLFEALTRRLSPTWEGDSRISRSIRIIRDGLAEPLSRRELAAAAGLSETRFHDVFQSTVGEAPMQYVNRLRLERAVGLLSQTREPIKAIATACGFTSSQYFCRIFRQNIGTSPGQYRRNSWA